MRITRHTCPRDCPDACGMLAYVNDKDRLVKVTGDNKNNYTKGKLCCKGYAYSQYVYHPSRIQYPMVQIPRLSGEWKRISWQEASGIICQKILKIKEKYSNYLPIGYMKGGGNYGLLAESTRGLFTSLGPITIVNAAGALCLAAAWDAQILDFGGFISAEPLEMKNAKTIILWGTNPVETAVHQISIIEKAKANGGKIILIDLYPSKTSIIADQFIRVKPGGDGALALSVLKQLLLNNKLDKNLVRKYTGWEEFSRWLVGVESSQLDGISGVAPEIVSQLAEEIALGKPVAFWLGAGMQRYSNGGQNIRNIHALAVASGNIGVKGGGIFFPRIDHWKFTYKFDSYQKHKKSENRIIGINDLAKNLSDCKDPPIELLWITSCNPLARGTGIKKLRKKIRDIDFLVTVDHFMTLTCKESDMVLPATTCFEAWDVVASYWHNWVGINQPAIEPVGECKSELQITKLLSKELNYLKPNITSFPYDIDDERWLSEELSPWLCKNLGIDSYKDLLKAPRPLDMHNDEIFGIGSKKYSFLNPKAIEQGCPELPILVAPLEAPNTYPYRFLLLHRLENLNSQLTNIKWLETSKSDTLLFISPNIAKMKGISSGEKIVVYNEIGEIILIAKIQQSLPDDAVFCYSMYDLHEETVNVLTGIQETDLGRIMYQYPGAAYHDTFVNLVKV